METTDQPQEEEQVSPEVLVNNDQVKLTFIKAEFYRFTSFRYLFLLDFEIVKKVLQMVVSPYVL